MDLVLAISSLVLAGASTITATATLINSLINRRMIRIQGEMKRLHERDLEIREQEKHEAELDKKIEDKVGKVTAKLREGLNA